MVSLSNHEQAHAAHRLPSNKCKANEHQVVERFSRIIIEIPYFVALNGIFGYVFWKQ